MSTHRPRGQAARPSDAQASAALLRRAVRRVPLRAVQGEPALRGETSPALFESLEQRRLLTGGFTTLGDELAGELSAVQSAMLTALDAGSRVPFLNEQLDQVQQMTLFTSQQLDQLKSGLNGNADVTSIKQTILTVLGPAGADVLADRNDVVPGVGLEDITVNVNAANGSATIGFELGRSLLDIALPLKFGLGLPGIPFNVTSDGGMLLDLEVTNSGVSFSYADHGNAVSIDPGSVAVGAEARLAPGSTVRGTFGFFQVTADDLDGNSYFAGDFTLSGLTGTPTVSLSGDALVDLHLRLGAGARFPSLQADLKLDWDFGAAGNPAPSVKFENVGVGLGSFLSQLVKPALENVMFFTKPHQPVIDVLKARIPAFSDGTEALGLGEVSLLSLVKLAAGSNALPADWSYYINLATTIVDITDIVNNTTLGSEVFIELGDLDLSGLNGDLRNVSPDDLPDYTRIGEHGYNFNDFNTGNLTLSLDAIKGKLDQLANDGSIPGPFRDKFKQALDKLSNGVSYSLPILDNPSGSAFKLLLGQDAELATFQGEFNVDAKIPAQATPFSLFGYGIKTSGQIDIDGKFRAAYDTLGLRRFLATPSQPNRLLDGLYIDASSYLTVNGEVKAELDAPVGGIVGVNVFGRVYTPETLSLRVNDGPNNDGKHRPFAEDNDCVVKADGRIDAEFNATVKVGVTVPNPLNPLGPGVFVGVDKKLLGGNKNLIEFGNPDGSPECLGSTVQAVSAPPVLAGIVGDGQLQLYIGPNANKRQNVGSNTDVAENYTVTHLDGAAGDEKVSVTAFGYTQVFEHVKSIWGDGGNENDVLTLEAGVLAPATLLGGNGDDALSHNGPGRAEIRGWFGNDTITGGAGNDSLYGEDGEDRISAAGGNDHAEGNAGNDQVFAGDGNDSAFGGTGNDDIDAGGGDDSVQGNEGDDQVEAGAGNDFVLGGEGRDLLRGGAGNDTVLGENDPDSIIGDAGDDFLGGHGGGEFIAGDEVNFDGNNTGSLGAGGGHDSIFGDGEGDIIFAQGGNDYVEGNAGFDGIFGGDGNDRLIGGSSNVVDADAQDSILGEGGDDIILGDDGAISPAGLVTLGGGSGNDTLRAGAGNDSAWGQAGNDSMFGDAGDDDLIGNDGDDTTDGGAGADVMLGDNGTITPTGTILPESNSMRRTTALATNALTDGADSMRGGADADTLYGQGANDSLFGDGGVDYLEGNQGADALSGGDDDDDLIGGSSAAGTPDGSDTLSGDGGHDVLAGDNAIITRLVSGASFVRHLTTGMQNNALVRSVELLNLDTIGAGDSMSGGGGDDSMHGQLGNDSMFGNDGHDDLTGQLGDDLIDGGTGDDGIVGDKGIITGSVLAGPSRTIAIPSEKLRAVIYVAGTRLRSITLQEFYAGGNDTLLGGANNDYIHGGAGNDLIEGDDPASPDIGGRDALFGDAGNDSVNGGADGDHLYGGGGNDALDGEAGGDTLYGGDGEDSLRADEGGDRLVDWFGNFNSFYVPGPGFGAPVIIRSPSPAVQQFLFDLAAADGSWDADLELQIVEPPSPANAGDGN